MAKAPPGAATRFVVLGALTALGAAATDMYAPAFPEVSRDLSCSAAAVQGSVASFLFALAIGQLIFGSLSDALGRRRLVLVGIAGFTVSSLAAAAAPGIAALTAIRGAQGLFAAAGVVIGRAIVQDLARDSVANRQYSRLVMVTGLAPILAPLIGASILRIGDWRTIFVVQAGLGAALLVAAGLLLRETHPISARIRLTGRVLLTAHGHLLGSRRFAAYVVAYGLAAGIVFAYVGGYAFLVQDVYHASPLSYALLFGANAVGMVGLAQANFSLSSRFTAMRVATVGLVGSTIAAAALTGAVLSGAALAAVVVPMWLVIASRGAIMPNLTSLAMAESGTARGSASALLGTVQWTTGGCAALLAGIGGASTGRSMAVVILAFSAAATLVVVALPRHNASRRDRPAAGHRSTAPLPLYESGGLDAVDAG